MSQLHQARTAERVVGALEISSEPTAVLNENRQVVFANTAFQALVGADTIEELCGARPGEILGCQNAEQGCGDSPACRFCGAAQAIVESLRSGQPLQRECHIAAVDAERTVAHDFLVRTIPFTLGGKPFVLVGLLDVSHQKRRLALERIFFHDILNTASSFQVHLELLKKELASGGAERLISRLETISDTLVQEIQGQRILLSAENGTLSVHRDLIESHAVVEQLIAQLEGQTVAQGKSMGIAPFSESFTFVSDDTLLKRILENMLKNALEASPEGRAVTIRFGRKESKVFFDVHNAGVMEDDVQRQIFRRYFSTKGQDRGLGTWSMKL
ncbi:MAG TPA: ATP-binding protein, partial [Spirochaetia bacterium]|nr:ATP-binding protein [Spirochaetia bacterium]